MTVRAVQERIEVATCDRCHVTQQIGDGYVLPPLWRRVTASQDADLCPVCLAALDRWLGVGEDR